MGVVFLTPTRWLQLGLASTGSDETTDARATWHLVPTDYAQAAGVARRRKVGVVISAGAWVASGCPPEEINLISRARSRDLIFDGMPESIERRMSAACPPHSQHYVAARLFVLVG
jgi:hypothetical protein